jgi:hypothetical protein
MACVIRIDYGRAREKDFTDCRQSGLPAYALDFGAGEPFGIRGEFVEADSPGNRLPAESDFEDLLAVAAFGQWNLYEHIEATRSSESGIEQIRSVRGAEHEDALEFLDAIHFGEELANHAFGDVGIGASRAPCGHERTDPIKKDDAGGGLFCLAENVAYGALRFTDVLGQEGWALHGDEVALALTCNGLCE